MKSALDIGEERVAAKPGNKAGSRRPDGPASPSKLTGNDAMSWVYRPARPPGLASVAYHAVPVCMPFSNSENVKVNETSAFESPLL